MRGNQSTEANSQNIFSLGVFAGLFGDFLPFEMVGLNKYYEFSVLSVTPGTLSFESILFSCGNLFQRMYIFENGMASFGF